MSSFYANDILTDDADWDAETWDMEREGLEHLERGVRSIYERSTIGIEVGIIFPPDKVEHFDTVSIEEMSSLIRNSALGTRTCYRLNKSK